MNTISDTPIVQFERDEIVGTIIFGNYFDHEIGRSVDCAVLNDGGIVGANNKNVWQTTIVITDFDRRARAEHDPELADASRMNLEC